MDIKELLDSLRLEDVRAVEQFATLKTTPESGLAGIPTASRDDVDVSLDVFPVSWNEVIEAWFRAGIESESMRVTAAVAVVYRRDSQQEIPLTVREEFLERIGIMTAFPYLRADVQALSTAMRIGSVTLPLLRPGDFSVSLNLPEPAEGSETG